MKIRRKAITVLLATLACLLVLLVIFLNTLIGKNRERIREEIEKSLGRSLRFDELRLSFWGGIGLLAKQLSIAEDPRFAATPFIQTKELRVQLRWLPLLLGNFEIKKIVLEDPEIQIIRNEEGLLNLSALAGPERRTQEAGREAKEPKEIKKTHAVSLLPSAIYLANGKIDYIDRSFKEPVEMRVRNVKLDLKGLALSGSIKVKLSARLFEGQGQNVSVEGLIGPLHGERDWTQYPLDLQTQVDALLLPQLYRAVPFLRESLAPYLGATGPLMFQAKFLGTFDRPQISDLTIAGALFGAAKNNATIKGKLDFSKGHAWREGEIQGKVVVDPVGLDYLKKIPFLRQTLPTSLTADGPWSVASELQGSFENLKTHTLIKAGESEIRYGDWLNKGKGIPAQMEVNIERQKDRLVFEESSFTLYNLKLKFSGLLEEAPERRLTLRLSSNDVDLSGWEKMLLPLSSYSTGGVLRWDLAVKKNLGLQEANLDIRGSLALDQVQAKNRKDGRSIEKMNARISFRGKDARIENTSLRLGSSELSFEALLPDLSQPSLRYSARSSKLNLGDLMGAAAYKGDEIRNLSSTGEIQLREEKTMLRGNLSSPEGILQEIPYRNLRGEIVWSPHNVGLKNLSFQALGGAFQTNGSWEAGSDNALRLTFDPSIEAMDLKALLSQKFPNFKDHIEGQLNFKAKLSGEGKNGTGLQDNLQGEGAAQVRGGSLKDFNLVERVLTKVTGLPGVPNLISSRIPARYSTLLQRRDTPFESLAATFTVKQGRIYSEDLRLATPDYSISGEGSIGFDKTMRWNATLVMSAQFTQDILQEHKNARYMLDRQGRLAVPFRLEGTLPHVQAKPDLQGIAEAIQRGALQRGIDRAFGEKKEEQKKGKRDWIQKGLEQLFGK